MPDVDEGPILELEGGSWERRVERSALPVGVMFYSPSCPHCRAISPYFEEYAKEYKGRMIFGRLNVTVHTWIGEKYGIRGTPTFKFFCNGKPVQEIVGAVYPALIKRVIEDVIRYGPECAKNLTEIDYEITGYG
ncbi:MAG: thioredoxin family protein [Methanomicrobiales archaeon]|nr:thioredoxin family protein [Methanomicrobiales archaeon]